MPIPATIIIFRETYNNGESLIKCSFEGTFLSSKSMDNSSESNKTMPIKHSPAPAAIRRRNSFSHASMPTMQFASKRLAWNDDGTSSSLRFPSLPERLPDDELWEDSRDGTISDGEEISLRKPINNATLPRRMPTIRLNSTRMASISPPRKPLRQSSIESPRCASVFACVEHMQ